MKKVTVDKSVFSISIIVIANTDMDARTEERRKIIDSGAYVMPSTRTTQEMDNYR